MTGAPDREDPPLFRVFNEIGIIEQLAGAAFRKALPDGLQVSHFGVLNHMVRLGDGWTPARLASAFQLTRGAMTNTLKRLEARGLARIEPDPDDGRVKRVFLTDKGRMTREACIKAVMPLLGQLHADLGSDLFARLLPDLVTLRTYLDAARDQD